MLVHSILLERYIMIRKRNTGHSFYGQNFNRFIPFFGSRLFISKESSLFVQGRSYCKV